MIKTAINQQKGKFILSILLSALSACFSIFVLSSVNDLATSDGIELDQFGLILLGVMGLFVSSFISQTVLSFTGTKVVASVRSSLSEQFLKQPFERLMSMEKGHVTGSLISDVTRIASMLMVAPLMIFNLLVLAFCFAYLSTISVSLFLVLLGFLAVAIVSSAILLGKAQTHFRAMREEEDKLFEGFRAIEEAKRELSNDDRRIDFFLNSEVNPSIESTRQKDFDAQIWWNLSGSWSSAMIFVALLCIIYTGSTWLALSSEVLLQFVIVTLYMTGPIAFIVNSNQSIGRGLTSINRLKRLQLETPRTLDYQHTSLKNWKTIGLESVEYRYKNAGSDFIFGPVNYKFNRGDCYFIVGGNGSGKSTLAQILTGLVAPDNGTITVDNVGLDKNNAHEFRNLTSSIFFDVYLFKFFLNEKAELADDTRIINLAKQFSIAKKLSLKNGRIKDDGVSQGQKKRIALIQSILQDKDILLFDEVAADQDPVFKQYFYKSLLPELKAQGKTLLVISHDDRYFDCADHIIKMEDGKLVQNKNKEQSFEQVATA